ncbi:MAG: FAD-dependent monooxygenase [Myxococcales bacterium]|nr:FAD-dependent monooxygenase [Myxococcales bacterium]
MKDYDVVVVGAGPIGSAAAFALAKQGKRCLLLEAAPDAVRRYAGEWMHPTVVALMGGLGLQLPKAGQENDAGAGFIVHPEDGSAPIPLPYPDSQRGFCCSHYDLSVSLREQAVALPNVEYIPFARAIDAQRDGRVRFHVQDSREDREVSAELIIGAEGRSSVCRRALASDTNRDVVSYMAALSLDGRVALPTEGYGHIFMGGPGLVLAYRVSRDEVRLCLDVPEAESALRRDKELLYRAFEGALPASLREPARAALSSDSTRWTATFFQPRTVRGEGRIALVGDSVGLCHPLCSAGVAVGLLDVTLLAQAVEAGDLASYRENGARETWVPELMSTSVYQLLGRPDVGDALRQTLYEAWRKDPSERDRTLNILMGAERRPAQFVGSFARIGLGAVSRSLRPRRAGGASSRDGSVRQQVGSFARWLRWPVASVLPKWAVDRIRPASTIHAPF